MDTAAAERPLRKLTVVCHRCKTQPVVTGLCDQCTAAQVAGHDTSTETGRSDARSDYRTWDLLDRVEVA